MDARVASSVATPVTKRMWLVGVLVAQSSFLFGFSLAALNACLDDDPTVPGSLLSPQGGLPLSLVEQEAANGLTVAAATVATLLTSAPMERFGRRATLLWNNVAFVVGAGLCCVAWSAWPLLLGRTLVGVSVGISAAVPPVLLAELAPTESRGKVVTLHQLLLTCGILFAVTFGALFVGTVNSGWRIILGLGAVPATIQSLAASIIPESPRWLLRHGGAGKARRALARLRHEGVDVGEELEAMAREAAADEASQASGRGGASWSDLWSLKRPLLVGMVLLGAVALTGINAVTMYSVRLFEMAGVGEPLVATNLLFVVNVGMTVASGVAVDRVGRRALLLGGTGACAVAHLALGITLIDVEDPDVYGPIAVCSLVVFVAGFAIGLGAVSWIVLNEVMPTRVRSKGFAICGAFNWLANLAISSSTLSAVEALGGGTSEEQEKAGVGGLFLIFDAIAWGTLIFIYFVVPETKGVAMETANARASFDGTSVDVDGGRLLGSGVGTEVSLQVLNSDARERASGGDGGWDDTPIGD